MFDQLADESDKFKRTGLAGVDLPDPDVEDRSLCGPGCRRKPDLLSGGTDLGDEDRKHVFEASDFPVGIGPLPVKRQPEGELLGV